MLALDDRKNGSQAYSVLDPMVEDNIHHSPGTVVDSGRWRNIGRANEDQRPVDLLEPVLFGVLPSDISCDWRQRSDPEKVEEFTIDLSDAVQSAWTYKSPDHSYRTLAKR